MGAMGENKVVFYASFPGVQSAIKVSGNGDGMRIMLDIPENQMVEAVKLMLYRQCALQVTIEPYEQKTQTTASTGDATNGDRPVKRTAAKQRK